MTGFPGIVSDAGLNRRAVIVLRLTKRSRASQQGRDEANLRARKIAPQHIRICRTLPRLNDENRAFNLAFAGAAARQNARSSNNGRDFSASSFFLP